jgi:hypothetical protein
MSYRVSKEWSASAKSLRKSRECFIEVYIDNWWIIIIVYSICFMSSKALAYIKDRQWWYPPDEVTELYDYWGHDEDVDDSRLGLYYGRWGVWPILYRI